MLEHFLIQNQLTSWLMRRTPSTGVRRVIHLAAAVASETGNVRTENQDRAVIVRGRDNKGNEYTLAVVSDGIGGMHDGAGCAATAIGAFVSMIEWQSKKHETDISTWLYNSSLAANNAVYEKYNGKGGATLVAVLLYPNHPIYWLSIGDSRIYSASGVSLKQISIDDTIAGQLGKNEELYPEQSKLLQFIGMGSDLEPHTSIIDDSSINSLVLTTDGVHYIAPSPNWLGRIVGNSLDSGSCVKKLIDLAMWCGGQDNATVVMLSLQPQVESSFKMLSMLYSCIEVWDPFGEIQIISNTYSNITEPSKNDLSTPESSLSKEQLSPENINNEVKTATKGRKRTSKKPKGKSIVKQNDSDSVESEELPQLHIEFPSKEE